MKKKGTGPSGMTAEISKVLGQDWTDWMHIILTELDCDVLEDTNYDNDNTSH